MPDIPGAPSQLNDSVLNEWPFGQKGSPVWHMDHPIDRLLRLCDRYDRVCLGWTGQRVGSPEYHKRMEEVGKALGNTWPPIHMLRGIAVAWDYPFTSADSTSLAQNGWKYDTTFDFGDRWAGRRTYADTLEGLNRGLYSSKRRSSRQGRGSSWPHLGDNLLVDRNARCGGEAEGIEQLSFDL